MNWKSERPAAGAPAVRPAVPLPAPRTIGDPTARANLDVPTTSYLSPSPFLSVRPPRRPPPHRSFARRPASPRLVSSRALQPPRPRASPAPSRRLRRASPRLAAPALVLTRPRRTSPSADPPARGAVVSWPRGARAAVERSPSPPLPPALRSKHAARFAGEFAESTRTSRYFPKSKSKRAHQSGSYRNPISQSSGGSEPLGFARAFPQSLLLSSSF